MADLLGYLATRLAPHPENIATEALTFVLQKSAPARSTLLRLASSLGNPISEALDFSSQAAVDGTGIPDIVGRTADGTERLLLEAKFWAGLTPHQPVSYLRRLKDGGSLLFIVPTVRAEFVWRELERRVRNEALSLSTSLGVGTSRGSSVAVSSHSTVTLALTTWETVIASLVDALNQFGDTATLSDVEQVRGLCRRMNDEGFLPLTTDELTSGLWRRVAQMSELIPDIIETLRVKDIAIAEGRLSHGGGWTGQKVLKMKGMNVGLYFDTSACASWFPTPFWLSLPAAAQPYLSTLSRATPRRVFEQQGSPYVALPIRTGVERPDVVVDVVCACAAIAELLPTPTPGILINAQSAPGPVDDATSHLHST
ncbi:hypothetical protein [Corallococcus sp. CA049B]|uniref:hypothetical protein n=1 Tax=Corallococcus sp. CA049B TaxID=2316730 RepID=UPI0011C3C27A|nr:hypothetical protein [Corallococcus sp. CA049B]